MSVSATTDAAATPAATPAATGGEPAPSTSFAGALASASKVETHMVDNPNGAYRAPVKETVKAVAGHAYADVLSGPRNGMYVNTSGNKRHGQAFVLVKRHGREFHVYGTGRDRVVVCLKKPSPAPTTTTPTTNTAPSGTTGAAS